MLRPVRVVEIQNGSLREGVRRPLIVGVLRVAVDLDRPELVRLDQSRNRARSKRMRRGKIIRFAQDQVLGRLDVGIDRLVRLLGAPGKAGQRHRRSHQLHEPPARYRVHPLLRRGGKLPLHRRFELRCPLKLVDRTPVSFALRALQLRAHLGQRQRDVLRFMPVLVHTVPLSAHRWQTSQLARSLGVRIL